MDKNEILERSRKENQGADLVELEVGRKSRGIAGAVTLTICAVLNLISTFAFDQPMPLFWERAIPAALPTVAPVPAPTLPLSG